MASPSFGEGRVTSARYWRLVADGVISSDDRVELLDGVIVAMSPQNNPHARTIAILNKWLVTIAGGDAHVRPQLPLALSDVSVPEPDFALIAGPLESSPDDHPTTALLVIEVADSSLIQDRLTKAPLYAAAGIPEYWIVNLRDRCVEVHRRPHAAERRYLERRIARSGDAVAVASIRDATITVDAILPPH